MFIRIQYMGPCFSCKSVTLSLECEENDRAMLGISVILHTYRLDIANLTLAVVKCYPKLGLL
jgi:hypothetical protein